MEHVNTGTAIQHEGIKVYIVYGAGAFLVRISMHSGDCSAMITIFGSVSQN